MFLFRLVTLPPRRKSPRQQAGTISPAIRYFLSAFLLLLAPHLDGTLRTSDRLLCVRLKFICAVVHTQQQPNIFLYFVEDENRNTRNICNQLGRRHRCSSNIDGMGMWDDGEMERWKSAGMRIKVL